MLIILHRSQKLKQVKTNVGKSMQKWRNRSIFCNAGYCNDTVRKTTHRYCCDIMSHKKSAGPKSASIQAWPSGWSLWTFNITNRPSVFFDFCLKFIVLMYKYRVSFFLCIFPRSWPLAISSTFRLRHCCSVLQALGWWMQLIWIVRQVYREGGYRLDVHAFGSPYWGMQIRMIYSGRLWIHR